MTTPITSGQWCQIGAFAMVAVEQALKDLGLTQEEARHVIESGDEFTKTVRVAMKQSIGKLRSPEDYASEEVGSTYGYLSGYEKPNGITEQANLLRTAFPGIGFVNLDYQAGIEQGSVHLPKGAEGWGCVPNWIKSGEAGSGSAGNPIFGNTYSSAVRKMLDVLKNAVGGKFNNYNEGSIEEAHLRQSAHSKAFWKNISESQDNPDILIVPVQLGLRHRGRSIRRARAVFFKNEFDLGAFATGCLLLTHPKRLTQLDDLWINCAGDEFAPKNDFRGVRMPSFHFGSGELCFMTDTIGTALPYIGSVSAFLPALGVES